MNGVPLEQARMIVAQDQHESVEVHIEHVASGLLAVLLERFSGTLQEHDQPGWERDGLYALRDLDEFVHGLLGVEKNNEQWSRDGPLVLVVIAHQIRESYGRGHDPLL